MTKTAGWHRILTVAAIDVLLLVAAGSAIAAPAASVAATTPPALPALLLLGFGLCGVSLRWRTGD